MKVAIIHPWLPQYRVDFFKQLMAKAAERNITVDIYFGATPPEWKARADSGVPEGFTRLATRFFSLGNRSLNRKSLKSILNLRSYDLIVVEQAVRNIETYELLLRRVPLAFWGHGRTQTLEVSATQERLKQWMTLRSKWFFAYTQGGRDAMTSAGMDPRKITVVQNSINTEKLHDEVLSLDEESISAFRSQYDLRGKTALYIGGLDSSKRIPFLLKSADIAASLDRDFRLIIAGTGDERKLVEEAAATRPYIAYVGAVFGEEKALSIACSEVIAMPGRVGLVAVDSFATCTPIVTTQWQWHSVEFEYLRHGDNAMIASDDVESYGHCLVATLQDVDLINSLKVSCDRARQIYTMDAMVGNFLEGLSLALGGDRK